MRLVGASNWFIRTPFLLEGVLQALIGAALAILSLVGLQALILPRLAEALPFLPVTLSRRRDGADLARARSSRASSSALLGSALRHAALPQGLAPDRLGPRTRKDHMNTSAQGHPRGLASPSSSARGGFIGGYRRAPRRSPIAIAHVGRTGQRRATSATRSTRSSELLQDAGARARRARRRPPRAPSRGCSRATATSTRTYFDTQHFKYFNEESMGEFGGIGVVLGEKDGTAYVVEVYKRHPADEAGIKAGRRLRRDRRRRRATSGPATRSSSASAARRAPRSSSRCQRPARRASASAEEYTFTLTRAMINFPNIEVRDDRRRRLHPARPVQRERRRRHRARRSRRSTKKGAKSLRPRPARQPGRPARRRRSTSRRCSSRTASIVRSTSAASAERSLRATGDKVTDAPLVVLINGNSRFGERDRRRARSRTTSARRSSARRVRQGQRADRRAARRTAAPSSSRSRTTSRRRSASSTARVSRRTSW